MSTTRTKAELIVYATQHADLKVREAACESLYQLGRETAALEIRAVIQGTPTTYAAGKAVTP